MLLRDAIVSRIKAMPYFAGFTFTTNRMLQIMVTSLPLCGVYFIQETGVPAPESQTGTVAFRTTVRLGFSVIVLNNDGEKAENELDRACQVLSYGLFADPTLLLNSQFQIQGFANVSRQHMFGNIGQSNETPIAELRWELLVDLGTVIYEPVIPDVLEVIHVQTEYPPGEADGVPPIIVEYDLPQE
jgi:hypothetical protein